jgi:hypothetical protein
MPFSLLQIFRFGPAPFTFVMVAASVIPSPWRHYGGWMVYAIIIGAVVVALWHLALIVTEPRKITYFIYALFNLFLYAVLGFLSDIGCGGRDVTGIAGDRRDRRVVQVSTWLSRFVRV